MIGPGEGAASAVSLPAVLEARDRRAAAQGALLGRYGAAVISLTLVSPGPVKDSPGRRILMDRAETAVSTAIRGTRFEILAHERIDGPTGPEARWAVDGPPQALKKLLIGIEKAEAWGRLLDADLVVPGAGAFPEPLPRTSLGFPPRSCLVCGAPACECAAWRRHPPEVVEAAAATLILRHAGRP